jgi:hypothetical protein
VRVFSVRQVAVAPGLNGVALRLPCSARPVYALHIVKNQFSSTQDLHHISSSLTALIRTCCKPILIHTTSPPHIQLPYSTDSYLLQAAVRSRGFRNAPHLLPRHWHGCARRAWRGSGRGSGRAGRAGSPGRAGIPAPATSTSTVYITPVQKAEAILERAVRVEEPPVEVEQGRGLAQILVIQADNVGVNLRVRADGGAAVVHGALHQVLVVGPGVGEVGGGLAVGGPAGLCDGHGDGEVELRHGGDHGVHLRVVEVVVDEVVVGVGHGLGGLEEGVAEGDGGFGVEVGEEGVDVDHEGGARLLEEGEHGGDGGGDGGAELAGGGRVGDVQEADAVRGGDFDGGVVAELDEGGVDVLHRRDEQGGEGGRVGDDLGADGYGVDVGERDVGRDVLAHPVVRRGLRGADVRDLVVRHADHHADLRAGERLDHGRVVVVDAHAPDFVLLHERRGAGGGRDVVAIAPVDGSNIGCV